MTVEPLIPDAPPIARAASVAPEAFARALDAAGTALDGAGRAEDAFARGGGTLHDAVYERARADVALTIAVAAAQRTTNALSSILNMAV